MTNRNQEHYEIANKFGVSRPFTMFAFKSLYRQEYPGRISAPIPSDYCVNLGPKGSQRFPKFLRWLGRGRYELIAGAKPG